MKLPLEVSYGVLCDRIEVMGLYDAAGDRVVETDSGVYPPSPTDAEFIVRAVNNHAGLLAALRAALVELENAFNGWKSSRVVSAIEILRIAIAKAEGK